MLECLQVKIVLGMYSHKFFSSLLCMYASRVFFFFLLFSFTIQDIKSQTWLKPGYSTAIAGYATYRNILSDAALFPFSQQPKFFSCLECQTPIQSTFLLIWYSSTVNSTISLPIHNLLYKISDLNHMALFLLLDWMMVSALLGHQYLICK